MKKKIKAKINSYPNEVYEVRDDTDYLNFVTRSSTEAQRRKFNIGNIFINGAVCLKCKEFIRSKHEHDFRTCKCGAVAVDGGSWYAKRVFKKQTDFIDVIEMFYDSEE